MNMTNQDYHRIDSLIVFLSRILYAQWVEVTNSWGLTPPQNKILRILEKSGNQPISKLSDAIACAKSNLTGVIDSMVMRGLVRRIRSRKDRRIIQISLTEKSKKLLSSIPPWSEIYRHSLTTKLDESEAKTLIKILEKLISFYKNTNHENIKEEK